MKKVLQGLFTATLLLLAAIAWKYAGQERRPVKKESEFLSGTALPLVDVLNNSKILGTAAAVTTQEQRSKVIFQEDFDAPETTSTYLLETQPSFQSEKQRKKFAESNSRIVTNGGIQEGENNVRGSALELRGVFHAPLGIRFKPIRVTPGKRYRLSYYVATEGTSISRSGRSGTAGLFALKLVSAKVEPENANSDGDTMPRARLSFEKRSLETSFPAFNGSADWQYVRREFQLDSSTTNLLIELYHTWTNKTDADIASFGKVWFDSVVLEEIEVSPHIVLSSGLSKHIKFHPLATRVKMMHPPRAKSFSLKEAIYTPSPSEITFPIHLGENPVMTFRCGALDSPFPFSDDTSVTFEVLARQIQNGGDQSAPKVIFSRTLNSAALNDKTFTQEQLDLAPFAGQKIQLTLKTTQPDATPGKAPLDPGEFAAWINPIVSDRTTHGKNIVLVLVDTLSAFRTSMHGYQRPLTPNLEALSKSAISYKNAYATSSWTLPSFGSLLTGRSYAQHRAGEYDFNALAAHGALAPDVTTFVEALRERGWNTQAWINNPNMRPGHNVSQGFMDYHYYYAVYEQEAAELGTNMFLEKYKEKSAMNRFFLIHLLDPHLPYFPPNRFARQFIDSCKSSSTDPLPCILSNRTPKFNYTDWNSKEEFQIFQEQAHEATIAYTDEQVGRVLKQLSAPDAPKDTLVIVTSDHGEEFWEHGTWEHGHSLYDEIVHIPMLVKDPTTTEQRSEKFVSLNDVPHTILKFADIPPTDIDSSCCSLLKPESIPERNMLIGGMLYGPHRQALVNDKWKYIYNSQDFATTHSRVTSSTPRYQLFDATQFDTEKDNSFSANRQVAVKMHKELADQYLPWFKGSLLVVVRSGSAPDTEMKFQTRIIGKGRWKPDVKDLLQPSLANYRESRFTRQYIGGTHYSALAISVRSQHALLGFESAYPGSSPVEINVTGSGSKTSDAKIFLGCQGKMVDTPRFQVVPDQHRIESAEDLRRCLKSTSSDSPSMLAVFFGGKISEDTRDTLTSGSKADLQAELESLGYAE